MPVDHRQRLRIFHWQRSQQNGIHEAEDGGITAYDNSFSAIPFSLKVKIAA
jgi:hypothetical protein